MSRPLSERQLKRASRSLAGHARDKDRQRWKRKVTGQVAVPKSRRKGETTEDETLEDLDFEDAED